MNKVSRLLPLLAFVALLFACASKTCKIEGSIEGKNNGDTLLLITDMENGVPFDTIFLKDGKFSDEVPVDSTTLCFLKVTGPEEFLMPFFLESGTVKINIKENMTESTIGGTKLNNEWQKLNQAAVDFQNKMVAMQKKLGDPPTEEAKQQFLITMQAEQAKLADKYYKTAEKNIGNELGYVLTTNPQLLSEEQVLRLINKMPAKMHARKEVQQIEQYLKTMPQEMEEDAIIPDFSANDPNGKTVSAMEVIKKSKNKEEAMERVGKMLDELSAQLTNEEKEKYNITPSGKFEMTQTVGSPWFYTIFHIDPIKYLKKIKTPLLAISGEKDLQINANATFDNMQTYLKNRGLLQTKYATGLNHLLQPCTTGSPDEYPLIETTIAPEVLDWIVRFCLNL